MGIKIKSKKEIEVMKEGGLLSRKVKNEPRENVVVGNNAKAIDDLAYKLIKNYQGEPSFQKVEGYKWTTCVNINDGLVHGIPKKELVFKKGDLVSVDVGMFYKGFHTDTSFSLYLGSDPEIVKFMNAGREALRSSIEKCVAGNYVYDISCEIEDKIPKNGYTPVKSLVGHGVGRELHEDPAIPCFVSGERKKNSQILEVGMTLAIEVMYSTGNCEIKIGDDGWTISTRDGKISALFEDSVAITDQGFLILTD